MKAIGEPTFSTSALPNAREDLDPGEKKAQRHTTDISPQDFVEWHIDLIQMGVGGDNSWGARPHAQYSLPAQKYSYKFRLRPVTKKDGLMEVSKERF